MNVQCQTCGRFYEYEGTNGDCPHLSSTQIDKLREEYARRERERGWKAEEARQAEWARVAAVKSKRKEAGTCVNCGTPLSFMDRLLGREHHTRCNSFRV